MPKAQLIATSQIAERAFEIWEHEGKPHGRDEEHWARAEAELSAAMARMSPKAKRTPKTGAKPKAVPAKARAAKAGK